MESISIWEDDEPGRTEPIKEYRTLKGKKPDDPSDDRVQALYEYLPDPGAFDKSLGFALSQFIRHYCTLSRVRKDLANCYRDSPVVWQRMYCDLDLATLVYGASTAAIASRGRRLK